MNLKCAFSMLALTAAVINAAPVQTLQARKVDVDDLLDQMSSVFNDPANESMFNSILLSMASNMLPAGLNPSTEDLYAALASYREKIGPSLMAENADSMADALDNLNVNGVDAAQLADVKSMYHDSSAQSRMADMVSQIVDNALEGHDVTQAGKPTGSTDDDSDTKSDKEETTSSAASTKAGMLLMSVGAVAGAMVAMF